MKKDLINEKYLYVIKLNKNKKLFTDYIEINKTFEKELSDLKNILNFQEDCVYYFSKYIIKNPKIKTIKRKYNYCDILDKPYQEMNNKILNARYLYDEYVYLLNQKNILKNTSLREADDLFDEIVKRENKIYKDLINFLKAYQIDKTYQFCADKKDEIIAFSHRKRGRLSYKFKPSEFININIKTNFGFGNASYFYITIIYKDVMLTPFSEWTNYEISKFSEINRFTKQISNRKIFNIKGGGYYFKSELKNSDWFDAINFVVDANNIAVENEEQFITKYIINEIETMVNNLETIMTKTKHYFIDNYDNEKKYDVDREGRALIEFRAEKISGALNFIDKLHEYSIFGNYQKYIDFITNKSIDFIPIINNQLEILPNEISELESDIQHYNEIINQSYEEINKYKPQINKKNYNIEIVELKNELHTNEKKIKFLTENLDLKNFSLSNFKSYKKKIIDKAYNNL